MGSTDLRIPGAVLFLLLLVPFPLLSTESFLDHLQSWGDFYKVKRYHRRGVDLEIACMRNFDVYIIIDVSSHSKFIWNCIRNFVNAVIKKYESNCCPNTRFTIITFGEVATVHTMLASDGGSVKNGMDRLKRVKPGGEARNLQAGLLKASQLIQKEYNSDPSTVSVIIIILSGRLTPVVFGDASSEIQKLKQMNTLPISLGLMDSDKRQVDALSKSVAFQFFPTAIEKMKSLSKTIVINSCTDSLNLDTTYYCVGENYSLVKFTSGEDQINKDAIKCLYKKNGVIDIRPPRFTEKYIQCPGIVFNNSGESVEMDFSMDYGYDAETKKFTLKTTGKDCGPRFSEESPPIYAWILVPLVLIVLLLCCLYYYCRPEKKCPMLIIPCVCQDESAKKPKSKLDTLCNFIQTCSHMPSLWCKPRCKRKCLNINRARPCTEQRPCCPNRCLQLGQQCRRVCLPSSRKLPLTVCTHKSK